MRAAPPRRIARYVSGGFASGRVRRIASLAGIDLRPGWPRDGEAVAVRGHGAASARGERIAARTGASVLRFDDAFLRPLHTGRRGTRPLGLLIDTRGAHFDSRAPSDLETLLATHPFDDGALIAAARAAMGEFARSGVTEYPATLDAAGPPPGYVLVIDQPRDAASIRLGGAGAATFREMLLIAREEHPGKRIVIMAPPETGQGGRDGHYSEADAVHGATLERRRLIPAGLLAGAVAVYVATAQIGFEAIVHGHRPVVFGQPFYAGWGLSDDRNPVDRRRRVLTRTQLFAGAMVLYPHWHDPHADAACGPIEVIRILEARVRAWREDRPGWAAPGMRSGLRPQLRRFLSGRVGFRTDPLRRHLVWGDAPCDDPDVVRLADGFVQSRGPGARSATSLSLTLDTRGLHGDPARPSDLEDAIVRAAGRPPGELDRARHLRERIVAVAGDGGDTGGTRPDLPRDRRIVLVAGQETGQMPGRAADDAALLRAARIANPDAFVVYRPHPEPGAGRHAAGAASAADDAADIADMVAIDVDPAALIDAAHAVWTTTSPTGFEALMRAKPVTCLGAPFYAGWGLTDDRGPVPARRMAARPTLDALVHAALIAFPRYFDPVTGTACPPEVAVERLARGPLPHPGPVNRLLSRARTLWP